MPRILLGGNKVVAEFLEKTDNLRAFRDRQADIGGAGKGDVGGVQFRECSRRQRGKFNFDAAARQEPRPGLSTFLFPVRIDKSVPEREIGGRLAVLEIDDRYLIGVFFRQIEPSPD